ncbi:MAG: hypothetical protein MJ016_06025 [Victivallaceae bacterium]|nr:hypothetical protein [Victivallaceae bacterium]
MKKLGYAVLFGALLLAGCARYASPRENFRTKYRRLWDETVSASERTEIENSIVREALAAPSGNDFIFYMHERMTDDEKSALLAKHPILDLVEEAFDRVLDNVKNDVVPEGEVHLYYLYNMGFVVKTPTTTFGIDLCHRRAPELVPYLDFAIVSHNHEDHTSWHFLRAMDTAKKLVFANFHSGSGAKIQYDPGYSKEPFREIKMPTVTIRTYEADHLNYKWYKFNMPSEIVCQSGDKEFVIFHGGDSCDTMQWVSRKAPDVLIAHPGVGGDIIHGAMSLDAKLTLVCHLLEIQHGSGFRWPFAYGYNAVALLQTNYRKGAVPHWGEKIVLPFDSGKGNNVNLAVPEAALPFPKGEALRIMAVGDELTRGNFLKKVNCNADANGGGYRLPLQKMLAKKNIPYLFVGEIAYWAWGNSGFCGVGFQRYHHGLAGFDCKKIREGGDLPFADMKAIARPEKPIKVPGIAKSLEKWHPDVVLLMAGSNGCDEAERINLLQEIADHFTGTLFVATIPMQKSPRPGIEKIAHYNATLPDAIAQLKNPKCKIFIADVAAKIAPEDILPDGINLTQAGEKKVAAAFFEAIKAHRAELLPAGR